MGAHEPTGQSPGQWGSKGRWPRRCRKLTGEVPRTHHSNQDQLTPQGLATPSQLLCQSWSAPGGNSGGPGVSQRHHLKRLEVGEPGQAWCSPLLGLRP